MDSQQEQQCSHDMRELARQYADGRFNKEEYRHRRRELLAHCSGEAPTPPTPDSPDAGEGTDAEKGQRILRIIAMICLGLMAVMVAAIIGLG